MEFEVLVVGGGPAGSYSAARSSALGLRTALIEEHTEAGRPQQCAGLVNPDIFHFEMMDRLSNHVILKEIFGADIFSPSGLILPLKGSGVKALTIDRAEFDKELLRLAARCGTKVFTGQRVTSVRKRPGRGWEVSSKGREGGIHLECDLLLGCDGPASLVRRCAGMEPPKETITGISVETEVVDGAVPHDKVGVYTGKETARGFFAWAIPSFGRSCIRIGASSIDPRGLVKGFTNLLKDRRLARFLSLPDGQDIKYGETSVTLGPIPMGSPANIVGKDVVILGDSAGMAKPTSGGGIYPLLRAVDLFISTLGASAGLSQTSLDKFEKDWRKGYGRELERAFIARKILSDITDDETDMMLERLSRKGTLEMINDEGDIDHPMTLAVSLIRTDPGLFMLLPRFIPHLKKVL
ncbi:MAG: NAD(P)/FAD-dependent oxidoreductase [Candidatus Thermoplasmatota archaeon]|jgi:geranylgeranyl reductase family protein|nr:NAD(P)/FAD-dependent oxidoreductase [Candidatus Thermoplasmatota archaeon]